MYLETSKVCTGCGEEKDLSLFGKDRRGRNGLSPRCKACIREKNRKYYYKRNKNRKRRPPKLSDEELSRRNAARAKRWREKNPDYMKNYRKKEYADPVRREKVRARSRARYDAKKEEYAAYHARYRAEHREELLQKNKEWREAHPDYNTAKARKERARAVKPPLKKRLPYKPRSCQPIAKLSRESNQRRYNSDLSFKIATLLRGSLNKALCGESKGSSVLEALGCSLLEFREYLESMFYTHPDTGEEMTWENHTYYGWHIDHIIPVSSFDLTDKSQLMKAFHYTNMQPLWAEENFRKSTKVA